MIPHYLKDGKKVSWPADKANILYQQFRTEIITELRRRDKAEGIPENGQVYDEIRGDKNNPDKVTGYKVDPVLARKAHSGADTNNRLKKRWYDYCIVPHEIPDNLMVPIPEPTYKPSIQPDDPGNVEKESEAEKSKDDDFEERFKPSKPVNVPALQAEGAKERKKNKGRDLKG